jgi:hypothetical protein
MGIPGGDLIDGRGLHRAISKVQKVGMAVNDHHDQVLITGYTP